MSQSTRGPQGWKVSPTVLIYKVNRHPPIAPKLTDTEPEGSKLAHLASVLEFGRGVRMRRDAKKEWRLGNRELDPEQGYLAGRVGWMAPGEARSQFDEPTKSWVTDDLAELPAGGPTTPFAYDEVSERLYIIKHPQFSPGALRAVFESLMVMGETKLGSGWSWEVEALLDEEDFDRWLAETASVVKITLIFRRPNPTGSHGFRDELERMEDLEARYIKTEIRAADGESGLKNVPEDPGVQQARELGADGYARIKGLGYTGNRRRIFDQSRTMLSEELPEDDEGRELWARLIDFIRGKRRDV